LKAISLRAVVPSALMCLMSYAVFCLKTKNAQDHLISPQAMQKQMTGAASAQQKNIETVTDFLSSPVADRAMRDAQYNPGQVKTAVPSLSDQELASLAVRSADAQQKFA